MNKSLKYSEDVVKMGFAGSPDKTAQQQKDMIFGIANKCRTNGNYKPVFANESNLLPISSEAYTTYPPSIAPSIAPSVEILQVNPVSDTPSVKDLTVPPDKKKDNTLLNVGLLIVGVFIIAKILE